ncbi:MAG: isochorismatase family protein [Betaproteobacteria bacterium]|nr:isochorismatase family protein [Betaproteobacteria bacterium]
MARDFEDHCWKDVIDANTLDIYQRYQRVIRIGERPALLVVDLYNLVYQGGARPVHELYREHGSTCGEYAWAAIEPTRILLKAARAAGIPVIYSTDDLQAKLHSQANRRKFDGQSFAIKEEFRPQPGDTVITKERASVFHGTPMIARLNELGVESLVVCGESTSGCVRASVVDAVSYGYPAVLVEECTFDRHLLSHKISLFDLHHKYAGVMHLDEVLAHLDGLSASRRAA